jgi:GH15 family glucan-1,4-alpha-glucosidase
MTGQRLDPDRVAALRARSVEVILTNQAASGAYLASPSFPVYRYSWLRDGAFIANAMGRAGHADSAVRFLDWCRRVVEARLDRIDDLVRRHDAGVTIEDHAYLHTRYTIEGSEGADEWWNHQLDGYGAWLWALDAQRVREAASVPPARFSAAVEATARYLVALWHTPCYDCWEEHGDQIHVATLGAIAAGLRTAVGWPGVSTAVRRDAANALDAIGDTVRREGHHDGHLVKWLGGRDVDANLLFCAIPFRLFAPDDPLMVATVSELTDRLLDGGLHRHLADTFFGGGQWILLTALLGSYQVAVGDLDGARARLQWVVEHASAGGELPEQVSDRLLHPERFDEWRERWGPVATPLLWSHAMFLDLAGDLAPIA